MNIPYLITSENLPDVLRNLASWLEDSKIEIRQIQFQPQHEIETPMFGGEKTHERATLIVNISFEVQDRKLLKPIDNLIQKPERK